MQTNNIKWVVYIKRIVCFALVFFWMPMMFLNAHAIKRYGNYLLIEEGKSKIVMSSGECIRLHTNSYPWGVPVYKNISYSSSNGLVATVDDSGLVRANMQGKAYITVTDGQGRTDSILVVVESGKKPSFIGAVIVIALAVGLIVKIKPTSV